MESKRVIFLRVFLVFTLLVSISIFSDVFAQTDKQVEKAIKTFDKKGYQEGIDQLRKYMAKSDYATLTAYETLVQMEYIKFNQRKSIWDNIEILATTKEEGDTTEVDSLSEAFSELMIGLKELPKQHFIGVCRESTIRSFSYTADIYLRSFLVDYDPDTNVAEKAKSYFDEGEEFFMKEDYELAELNYRKALNEDPNYYKAYLYLGDSFWARGDYDTAIVYFNMAKNLQPTLLEPRKYIVDALMEQGLYYRAKKECLEAFTVYPGFDMKFRLQQILMIENKYMEDHRFIRYFYPNDIKDDGQRDLTGIWDTYRSSKGKISKYCNEDGIIEPNSETEDIYLEVYSMRRMLKKHDDELPEHLEFAYKMMEEGYLECYIFVSLFHVDIYPQFKHYMSFEENRKKSVEYVDKYLIEIYKK